MAHVALEVKRAFLRALLRHFHLKTNMGRTF